jgi:hypothetical protein
MARPSGQPKRARFEVSAVPRLVPEDVEAELQADEAEEAEEDEVAEDAVEDEDEDEDEDEEALEEVAAAAEEENAAEVAEEEGAQIVLPTTSQGGAASVPAPKFPFRVYFRGGLHQPPGSSNSPRAPTKVVFTLEHGEHLRTAQPSVWLQEAVDMLVAQQHGSASDVDVRINLLFTQMFVYYQNSARLFEILSYLVTFLF